MDKELLTSSDLRGILQISEATVWRKVKSGALPAPIKVCGLTRWRRAEIAALIEPGTKPQPRERKRSAA